MLKQIVVGSPVPDVLLACVQNNKIRSVATRPLFANGRALVVGLPGAFTPVCTQQHVPDFVQNAGKLTASGFNHLICIATNDPFVLDAWARQLDPSKRLEFYSDGNLDFTRALKLEMQNRDFFLGQRSERYLMTVQNGTITRLQVEPTILSYTCTRTVDALDVELV